MHRSEKMHRRILWTTRTAILSALLITLQWSTAGTQAFAGQYITGTLVNCVLALTAVFAGLLSGITVAVLSPFFAFLLGIGPKLLQIVPCIAVGNLVYVLVLHFAQGRMHRLLALAIAAVSKFTVLYLAVVKVMIPVLGDTLKAPQVQTFTAMFSYPQLITALLGGAAALLILPVIRKAIKY